ncbi:hypothetical protein D9615_008258 [Tricholomella constricta]|uniref:Uncharacterized protein n=1 Tax=Tricholomella constricta TaxID=117010 RepID=A0A8H5H3F5_9AGAR|nr:hypothetical protein D9615_008258 [Tricholomella constricta]
MMQEYYQIGGFHPHIDWPECRSYDDKKLAQLIAGHASPLRSREVDSIELVLGIKRTGTTHLLLTGRQLHELVRAHRRPYPRRPPAESTDFESLSPIYFRNADEFADMLGVLKIKSVKKRAATDNSQANKQFVSGDDGIQRGGFEHGRLFYGILHNRIELGKYSLNDASWTRSVRVFSFVFTPRSHDTRPSEDRRKHPVALDCAISEATVPELLLRGGSSFHLYFTNNRFMNASSKRVGFKHGTTEELDGMVISARLKDFFSERMTSTEPIILLVHDEELSKNMLTNCGIDISSWETGIRGLLGFQTTKVHNSRNDYHRQGDHRRDSHSYYHDRRTRPRSRSRSPPRTYGRQALPRSRTQSYGRSPPRAYSGTSGTSAEPPRGAHAPVYVVDIKQQFMKLMQTATSSENVTEISKYLGLSSAEGWCAGNESVMIIDIWRSMISGPPIDEQRALRESGLDVQSAADPAAQAGPSLEYDSDQDPNSIQQETRQVAHNPDSDSDYGQSSDSDSD